MADEDEFTEGLPDVDPEKGAISTLFNTLLGGLGKIFGVIGFLIGLILKIIYLLLFKFVPFVVFYFGIPLFILGAIMSIIFMGGHVFFVLVFFIGMFVYFKRLMKFVYNLPKPANDNVSKKNNNLNRNNIYK
tara:strand:+ start:328 stop:723 length:396 start_codon:yes stop_codon:yes gene_type:complete